MSCGLVSPELLHHWQQLYNQLPAGLKSPFFTPDYYLSYQAIEASAAECFFLGRDENNFLFYPYFRKSINSLGYDFEEEYFDISGAYGYNGPTGVANDPDFVESFNQEFQEYLRSSKVVTEFVRYCPITENRRFHTYTQHINVLDNVYIDLSRGLDWVWNESFGHRVRTAVRKGESYELQTVIKTGDLVLDSDLDSFLGIYTSTMNRNGADSFYYFDKDFFQSLLRGMGAKTLLVLTYMQEVAISAELLLSDGELAFGFLGGTLGEYYQYKANTFQRWELIKYLSDRGIKKYSMGGGATRGDGIYDYKMSFARGCVNPFFIGTKVHNLDIYAEIISQWSAKFPKAAELYSGRLQGYRIQI